MKSILSLAEPRARAFAAFQQNLIQVAVEADAGDLAAQDRLEIWTVTAKQYASEIQRLSSTMSAGDDDAAIQRLAAIQADLMKEWVNASSARSANRSRKSMP